MGSHPPWWCYLIPITFSKASPLNIIRVASTHLTSHNVESNIDLLGQTIAGSKKQNNFLEGKDVTEGRLWTSPGVCSHPPAECKNRSHTFSASFRAQLRLHWCSNGKGKQSWPPFLGDILEASLPGRLRVNAVEDSGTVRPHCLGSAAAPADPGETACRVYQQHSVWKSSVSSQAWGRASFSCHITTDINKKLRAMCCVPRLGTWALIVGLWERWCNRERTRAAKCSAQITLMQPHF
jgi:hypothetical protein